MGSADVEALDRSFRSRILLLGLVCAGGIGLAVWEATREVGTGAPEDPRRVLVVTPDQRSGDDVYLRLFDRAGFVAEVDGLVGWENRARDYVADADVEGLALVLEFADLGGYGFVVLERPGEFEFGALELEPSIAEIEDFAARDYAVLSVGDLAFPHQLSVDEVGEDPILRVPGFGALQAIYRQPRLAADREILVERPTVEELKLEDAIGRGRQLLDASLGFPRLVAQVVAAQREALADEGVRELVAPLHTGSPLPIAGGGALLLHHELVVFSEDAQTLDLDGGERLRLDWLSPAALASPEGGPPAAEPCRDLHGGELRLDRHPSFEISRDGRFLAITTLREATRGEPERTASRLWQRLDEPGCRFVELGELPPLEAGESHIGKLAPASAEPGPERPILARIQQSEGGGHSLLRVWTTPSAAAWAPTPTRLLELDDFELRLPTFLDDHRLACLSTAVDPDAALPGFGADYLHVVDRRRPGTHLRIPAEFLGVGWRLRDLAWQPRPQEAGPWNLHLLLVADDDEGRSHLLELALVPEVAAAIDRDLGGGEPVPGEAASGLLTVAPDQLVVHDLLGEASVLDLAVDPTGRNLALVVRDPIGGDSEVALFDRASGSLRTLTHNDLRDYLPRFTSEGQLVFSSLMTVSISSRTFTVPRAVSLPGT